jgi:hypothetical protein
MLRLVALISLTLFSLQEGTRMGNEPAASFFVADSLKTEVIAQYDQQGVLQQYHARVFTPVCEVDKCYAIELNIYWDPIGRYHHYDTVPGNELTKLDHLPFINSDYQRLHHILSDPNSVLGSYTKDELVSNVRDSEIDGLTGATVAEIKETVIEGAVYSCHTLWQIVHGAVTDSLREATSNRLSEELVTKLVAKKDQEINYFIIENLSEEEYLQYLPEVLKAITDGEGYFAKNAIELMPVSALADSLSQNFFSGYFTKLNYFAQVALLKKLQGVTVTNELSSSLKKNLEHRNSLKDNLIRQLLLEE